MTKEWLEIMKLKVQRSKKSLLTVFTGLISEVSQDKHTLLKGGTDNNISKVRCLENYLISVTKRFQNP